MSSLQKNLAVKSLNARYAEACQASQQLYDTAALIQQHWGCTAVRSIWDEIRYLDQENAHTAMDLVMKTLVERMRQYNCPSIPPHILGQQWALTYVHIRQDGMEFTTNAMQEFLVTKERMEARKEHELMARRNNHAIDPFFGRYNEGSKCWYLERNHRFRASLLLAHEQVGNHSLGKMGSTLNPHFNGRYEAQEIPPTLLAVRNSIEGTMRHTSPTHDLARPATSRPGHPRRKEWNLPQNQPKTGVLGTTVEAKRSRRNAVATEHMSMQLAELLENHVGDDPTLAFMMPKVEKKKRRSTTRKSYYVEASNVKVPVTSGPDSSSSSSSSSSASISSASVNPAGGCVDNCDCSGVNHVHEVQKAVRALGLKSSHLVVQETDSTKPKDYSRPSSLPANYNAIGKDDETKSKKLRRVSRHI